MALSGGKGPASRRLALPRLLRPNRYPAFDLKQSVNLVSAADTCRGDNSQSEMLSFSLSLLCTLILFFVYLNSTSLHTHARAHFDQQIE